MTAAASMTPARSRLPFSLGPGPAFNAAIGVIVLATERTLESEWRALLDIDGVAFYVNRIQFSGSADAASLKALEGHIPETTGLIRPREPLDVVAFACASGAMVVGDARIAECIHQIRPGVPVTTPMQAAEAAIKKLGAGRIAVITPYDEALDMAIAVDLEQRGLAVAAMGSFQHVNHAEVARIDDASLGDAILRMGAPDDVEAVFVCCSSLRIAPFVEAVERRLGKPVLSSNHALAWHSLRIAGYEKPVPGFGRLFTM